MKAPKKTEFIIFATAFLIATALSDLAPCVAQESVKPSIIAGGINYPWGLLADPTNLYWADQTPGQGNGNMSIRKIGLGGGTITTLISGVDCPFAMAADSANLYWVECHKSDIQKLSKNGGGVVTLLTGANITQGIATDGMFVYFAAYDSGRMVIRKVGVNGGNPVTLGSGFQNPIVMAVDRANVYFIANADSGATINKVGVNGGPAIPLVTGENLPQGTSIAVDSQSLYWISNNGDAIKKVGINGGDVTTLVASNADGYHGILALDSTRVFWVSSGLRVVGKNGGDVATLAKSLWCPGGLALVSGNVYWTEGGCSGSNSNSGLIKRLQIGGAPEPPAAACSQAELGAAYQQGVADGGKNCRPQPGSGPVYDLTGLWQDDVGGRYRIRQMGDTVAWFDDRSPAVMNVLMGTIIENTINGRWVDVPGGQMLGTGFLSLRIDSNDKLVKTGSSVDYGGTVITRVGGYPSGSGAGSTDPPGAGTSSTSSSSGRDICANPRTQAIMDEWLSLANPPNNQLPGWNVHYDTWGRLVGSSPSAILTGLPQGVDTRLSRCEYLWSIAAALNSTNIGTMRSYLEQKLR